MPINCLKIGKFLLTAGLLLVLAQGLWQLPELQDYLSPGQEMKSNFQKVRDAFVIIEDHLTALRSREDYLKWFLAHNGSKQKVSVDRLLSFPFSESIRSLSPRYFWQSNIYLAQRNRVNVVKKLKYLDAFLNYLDWSLGLRFPDKDTAILPRKPGELSPRQQLQEFQRQRELYYATLNDLSDQLSWIEKHGYNN